MTLSKAELGYLLVRGILMVIAKSILIFLVFAGNVVLLWNFVAAMPPDVRKGWALPARVHGIRGYAPNQGLAPE
jgi:hypothetical protein